MIETFNDFTSARMDSELGSNLTFMLMALRSRTETVALEARVLALEVDRAERQVTL